MHPRTLALVIAATAIAVGCAKQETKPESTPEPVAVAAPAEAPAAAKPECKPEPTTKKTSKKAKKAAAAPTDCEPAKPKAETAPPAKAPETKPAAAAPAAPAAASGTKTGSECKPCVVKSKDGTFDGEVYGHIPAGSKWARLQIGMHKSEVERILGVTPHIRAYVTGKAFIPFYFGSDRHRFEAVYTGQGSVAYTGGSFGGGQGILMMINYDPNIQ